MISVKSCFHGIKQTPKGMSNISILGWVYKKGDEDSHADVSVLPVKHQLLHSSPRVWSYVSAPLIAIWWIGFPSEEIFSVSYLPPRGDFPIFFPFFDNTHSMKWKFLGLGSNLHHGSDLSFFCDNVRSLTSQGTPEGHILILFIFISSSPATW